jgi:carbon-monoxide dehydrogenase medium subunit
MQSFELHRPRSLPEALDCLHEHPDALLLGGGTALLILIKQRLVRPTALIDLKRIESLNGITETGDSLRIGAATRIREIERSPLVQARVPLLAEAAHAVASVRIRNGATIGGNLALADYQSDPATALSCLDAHVELSGTSGSRRLPMDAFIRGAYDTARAADEILTAVHVPVPRGRSRAAYRKFSSHSTKGRQTASVAVHVALDDGGIAAMRVTAGGAGRRPQTWNGEALRGRAFGAAAIRAAAEGIQEVIEVMSDQRGDGEYKRHIVGVLAERAFQSLSDGAPA